MAEFFAHGTTITFGGTAIGGLETITLPDQSKDDIDVTNHDSAGDREYLPGLREGGVVALTGKLLAEDAGQDALRTNFDAGATTATVVITLAAAAAATAVTYTFTGYVNGLGGEAPFDDAGAFSASIKVASAVVKAVA